MVPLRYFSPASTTRLPTWSQTLKTGARNSQKDAQLFITTFTLTTTLPMGRRAKHLTAAEKASASRDIEARYRGTDHAQIVHAASKRATHLGQASRKNGIAPTRCIPHLPALPATIRALQNLRLPDNEPLFTQALASATALDESELQMWKKGAPFDDDGDYDNPHSAAAHHFTQALSVALHGIRMREQNERDVQRCTEFKTRGWASAMAMLREEVEVLLLEWEAVQNIYHEYHQPREFLMQEHYRQWHARTIYHLYYLRFLD
ncbi:hypothetical protein C8R44DRAFT_750660 [Mycena epipterygia]|nr:hypothetical protein C8R44DRAFT_750660 [Mycena epipterygia]